MGDINERLQMIWDQHDAKRAAFQDWLAKESKKNRDEHIDILQKMFKPMFPLYARFIAISALEALKNEGIILARLKKDDDA